MFCTDVYCHICWFWAGGNYIKYMFVNGIVIVIIIVIVIVIGIGIGIDKIYNIIV